MSGTTPGHRIYGLRKRIGFRVGTRGVSSAKVSMGHSGGVDTRDGPWQGLQYGDELLLRYFYNDGSIQAAVPLRVVLDEPDLTVTWLAPATPIMYWATADGRDPRQSLLDQRFRQPLTTAPRTWRGPGVLRVMPVGLPYQVVHFWDDQAFIGWYVNFEAPRIRHGSRVDTVDWHLDLWITPDRQPSWKDEDEAEAALGTGHLRTQDLRTARKAGQAIIDSIRQAFRNGLNNIATGGRSDLTQRGRLPHCPTSGQPWRERSPIDNRTGAAAWECRPRTCSLSVSCFLWPPDCEVMAPEVAGDRRVSVATHVARSSDCSASTPTPTWPTLESICYQRHRRAASELEAGCVQNGADPGTGPSSDGREPLT